MRCAFRAKKRFLPAQGRKIPSRMSCATRRGTPPPNMSSDTRELSCGHRVRNRCRTGIRIPVGTSLLLAERPRDGEQIQAILQSGGIPPLAQVRTQTGLSDPQGGDGERRPAVQMPPLQNVAPVGPALYCPEFKARDAGNRMTVSQQGTGWRPCFCQCPIPPRLKRRRAD